MGAVGLWLSVSLPSNASKGGGKEIWCQRSPKAWPGTDAIPDGETKPFFEGNGGNGSFPALSHCTKRGLAARGAPRPSGGGERGSVG